ncbi:hypothetical protein BGX28_001781, partial [Mortierella sp. GBA30]
TFTLDRDAYIDNLSAIVYPLKKYDLILGKPWLTDINPIIDWRLNDLRFEHKGVPVLWGCRGFDTAYTEESNVVSALNFVSLASEPDTAVFLTQVKTPHAPIDLQPDLPEA